MSDAILIFHGDEVIQDAFVADANAAPLAVRHWRPARELFSSTAVDGQPVVLLADASVFEQQHDPSGLPAHVVVVAMDAATADALGARADLSMVGAETVVVRRSLLDAACRLAATRLELARARRTLAHTESDFRELSRIGMSFMLERDRSALLHLILMGGKLLTGSDGAGLLLLETSEQNVRELVPVRYEVDSLPDLGVPSIRYPIDGTSIVGHAALSKEPVVVDDAHQHPADAPFTGSAEFRRRYRYYVRSIMAVPMLDQRDEVLGVLFFMNRKSKHVNVRTKHDAERYVISYTERDVLLARSLASQAAASIENRRLYAQIEGLLESIVAAAISAIDERDPATAGHSFRVACLTTQLADAVSHTEHGPYRGVHYTPSQLRELRFAALLHDLGKVTVREEVLLKAQKLPEMVAARVDARFDFIQRTMELEIAERHEELCRESRSDPQSMGRLDAEFAKRIEELNRFRDVVRRANDPGPMEASVSTQLEEIASRTYRDVDGAAAPYLTSEELHYLRIPCGTLDEHERAEVELHVAHTRRFLSRIPWTNDLANLVEYACGHHEKLNGTGYPNGLRDREIPIETRIITLADMYDALTESDRPYKHPMSAEKAIAVLRSEADAGLLDRDLVDILAQRARPTPGRSG